MIVDIGAHLTGLVKRAEAAVSVWMITGWRQQQAEDATHLLERFIDEGPEVEPGTYPTSLERHAVAVADNCRAALDRGSV